MRIELKPAGRGIAIIIVLMVIMVLGALAAGFALSMRVELKLAARSNFRGELEWLARSGVEFARYILVQQTRLNTGPEDRVSSLKQLWAGGTGITNELLAGFSLKDNQLGEGKFSVTITDLDRKININNVDQELLRQTLIALNVDVAEVSTIVSSFLDWRDIDPKGITPPSGAESDYYLSLDPPYEAKNGLLDHISELLLVKGVTPQLYWGAAYKPSNQEEDPGAETLTYPLGLVDVFTTISSGKININTAGTNVLSLLPGFTGDIADQVVIRRAGLDGVEGTNDDMPFLSLSQLVEIGVSQAFVPQLSAFMDVVSRAYEVEIKVELHNVTKTFVAVIVGGPGAPNYQIITFYPK
jgi:general secretion pathway protein K